ncbi:hypothetical protein CSB45_05735 [candidate division KSB3 bacterium]|uniref:Methyltransferase domain-containing protein n=1 Tax=candidate division KSB3 bacterium TaxID=2044937 RepID=A0A2G6E6M5_9BACT|nr:MAG: hypothetical protein CSB45_05735 [candidate division KSB3 bacterium]PIE30153.1 MAG: hypothetical protein CSA57_04445 [candidate division KSB3 bacterium]
MELFTFPALYDTAFQFRDASDTVDFIEECVALYTEIPCRSVLDFACGTGHYTLEFARRGFRTYGVDFNMENCSYLEMKARSLSLDLEVLHADMTDVAVPEPCDLAVNFFDSLTYLPERQKVLQHFRTVAKALTDKGLYILELGVIDDFENHNVEEIWTEERRNFSVMSTYLRDGSIDPEHRTFLEHCTFGADCEEHHMFLIMKQQKLALTFHEFQRLVEASGCFNAVACYDEFSSDAILPQDKRPWRIIAVLQKNC